MPKKVEELREEAARALPLARATTDDHSCDALLGLAEELEAQAADIE
jgi:hypothetical protein